MLLLPACRADPLYVQKGAVGDLIDAQAGWFGRDREICIYAAERRCTVVARVRNAADVSADWAGDREAEIFVVGGTVLTCTPRAPGGFTVRLHQVSERASGAGVLGDHHQAGAIFRRVADSCGETE